jgi:hypothetical protein
MKTGLASIARRTRVRRRGKKLGLAMHSRWGFSTLDRKVETRPSRANRAYRGGGGGARGGTGFVLISVGYLLFSSRECRARAHASARERTRACARLSSQLRCSRRTVRVFVGGGRASLRVGRPAVVRASIPSCAPSEVPGGGLGTNALCFGVVKEAIKLNCHYRHLSGIELLLFRAPLEAQTKGSGRYERTHSSAEVPELQRHECAAGAGAEQ